MLSRVALVRTDVSVERSVSIIRVTRIGARCEEILYTIRDTTLLKCWTLSMVQYSKQHDVSESGPIWRPEAKTYGSPAPLVTLERGIKL
jgi:hypothetical protein